MRSPRRKRGRALALAALTLITAGAFVSFDATSQPAEAGWVGITGQTGCNGINAVSYLDLGVYYWNLSSPMVSAQDWVLANVLNPTDLGSHWVGSTTTDLVYRDLDYSTYCGYDWWNGSSGTVGLTTCDSLSGWGACLSHSIRYSTSYTNGASTTARRGLACHETGHAVSLSHATSLTTCMTPGNSSSVAIWNPTEIGWINANY